MTLEEAKEELKQLKEDLHGNGFVYGDFDKVIAIDTVLNYIENESIPKEKVEKLIKEELTYRNELPENALNTREMHEYTRLTLVELLGE